MNHFKAKGMVEIQAALHFFRLLFSVPFDQSLSSCYTCLKESISHLPIPISQSNIFYSLTHPHHLMFPLFPFTPLQHSLHLFLIAILHLFIQHWKAEVGMVASANRSKQVSVTGSMFPSCMWTLYLLTLLLLFVCIHFLY